MQLGLGVAPAGEGAAPTLADLRDTESGEDPVDRRLREAAAAMAANEAALEARATRERLRSLPAEAILALARALGGPETRRYRADSSSRPGSFYTLEVDGGDVSCSCPGFEYRGACTHARALKAALAKGGQLPDGIKELGGG